MHQEWHIEEGRNPRFESPLIDLAYTICWASDVTLITRLSVVISRRVLHHNSHEYAVFSQERASLSRPTIY